MLFLVPLGKSSHAGISDVPVTCPGLPGSSYKVICNWLLPMQDLQACEDNLIANQGQLPPGLGLEQFSKRPRAPLGLLPPERTSLEAWNRLIVLVLTVPLVIPPKLGKVGSQRVTGVGRWSS